MSNNLNDNEVNKVIAEFMGQIIINHDGDLYIDNSTIPMYRDRVYTESLDTLVQVFEKLKVVPKFSHRDEFEANEPTISIDGQWRCHVYEKFYIDSYWGDGETIQQAAAYATAKAIMELQNEQTTNDKG